QVNMPPQTYMIPEVRITANGEDPAYRVMRKAIGLANYHLNQVTTYDASIYIKGTAYFNKIPRAIANRIEVNGSGIKIKEDKAYMLESLNDVTYRAPDKYDIRIIASQNTIPGFSQNVNPMDYINASLYQPEIQSFVSPLARNAFTYYKFNFAGSFLQGNYMVDKIEVLPKRKSPQLCSGFLYIVEDLWCLHSSDLEINTIAGTLNLEQQYANVIMDAWLPVSHKLDMKVDIAGVDAKITYVSSLEYIKTVLNANLPKSYFEPQTTHTPEVVEKEVNKDQLKIQEILKKNDPSDRDMAKLTKLIEKETEKADEDLNKLEVEGTKFSIAPNAVRNDSIFWNEQRPVPLTLEERGTLAVRDSIMGFGKQDSIVQKDTVTAKKKQKIRGKDIILGKFFQSSNRKLKVDYNGLIYPPMLSFNTVDGLVYGLDLNYDYRPNFTYVYRWHLMAGYAFGRKAPDIKWTSSILYGPKIRGKIALNIDYKSTDFNELTGIPSFTNSFYTLFARQNYSKRFEKRSVVLEHRMDLATGLVFYATAEYQDRRELENNSDFSFFYRDSRSFTDNHPVDMDADLDIFNDSKALSGKILLEYTHEYYYRLKNGRKQYFKSEYPTIYASYKQAFPGENPGWADYSLVSGGLRHEREVGLLSEINYSIEAGYYLNTNEMHFSDYTHFKTSPVLLDMIGFEETFLLLNHHKGQVLDHYRAATNESYLQVHGKLTSPYLLLKLLPWMSERLWTESLSVDYLVTPAINNHIQVGYSLNEIAFLLDIGIYAAFEDWKYHGTGLRVNFRF
ncbi:MAG: DUF5686 family protein, partial [Bacteroidales bacterium]|nr:DUF5686 family protein [Bacteroidales bacterium]